MREGHILESETKHGRGEMPCRVVLRRNEKLELVVHLETLAEGDDGHNGHHSYFSGDYIVLNDGEQAINRFMARCKKEGVKPQLP